MKTPRVQRVALAALALVVLGAGCASDSDRGAGGGDDLTIAHVHGLGVTTNTLFVATHHGLYAYEDDDWSQRSSDRADHMGFSRVSDRLMFRSGHPQTGGNLGVQSSTDGGRTWEKVSDVRDSPVDFHAMAAWGPEPLVLYGWSQGLFRAVDAPERWDPVQVAGLPSQVAALAAADEDTVYASTPEGLYRSTDRGENWKRRSSDVVFALAISDDVLYASKAQGVGVMRSENDGKSWSDVSDGLGSALVVALGTSEDGRTVVAADQEAAIWRSTDRGETWTRVPPP